MSWGDDFLHSRISWDALRLFVSRVRETGPNGHGLETTKAGKSWAAIAVLA